MSNHIVANRNPCCGKWCLWQCYCYVLFSLISQTHIRSFPNLLEQSRSTTYHYGVIHKPRGHWRGCSPNVCWITTCILNNALCFTFQKCPKKGRSVKNVQPMILTWFMDGPKSICASVLYWIDGDPVNYNDNMYPIR